MASKFLKAFSAVLLLMLSVFLVTACKTANANEAPMVYENKEIPVGKYYLNGDASSSEYIEISEGFGFQYVGFNFYEKTYELNKGSLDYYDEETRQKVIDGWKSDAEEREKPRYYQISSGTGNLIVKNVPEYFELLSGEAIIILDDGSLQFDQDHVYKLVP